MIHVEIRIWIKKSHESLFLHSQGDQITKNVLHNYNFNFLILHKSKSCYKTQYFVLVFFS